MQKAFERKSVPDLLQLKRAAVWCEAVLRIR